MEGVKGLMVWVDGPIPHARDLISWAGQVARVCDVAAIFTPRQGALHLCRWVEGHLVDALRALQAQGLQTRITVWATSNPAKWRDQEAWLGRVLEMCAVGGVEYPWLDLDAESSWRGTQTLEAIGAFAVKHRLKVSANYVPSLKLPAHVKALLRAPWVFEVIPQAYSQWNKDAAWTHADLIRPRTFQRHALAQLQAIQESRTAPAFVRCGLMAAFQSHPAPHPQGLAALDAAVDEAAKHGAQGFALWSYKHLDNPNRPDATQWAVRLRDQGAALLQG